jgi:hypothetical protein
LEPALLSQIHEQISTRVEVEKIFGPPERIFQGANQKTLAFYKYQQTRVNAGWSGEAEGTAGTVGLRTLSLLYNTNQIVEKFLVGQSVTKVQRDGEQTFRFLFAEPNSAVRRESKGFSIGSPLANADFTKIVKGITSRGEIIQWFGAPTMQTLTIDGDQMLCWMYVRKPHRFKMDDREQEFRVVLDNEDFVKDFGLFSNTDLPVN